MGGAIGLEQPRLVDRRVNLRRREAGVAEQFLDRPKVAAPAQEMGGEGMAQRVGGGRFRKPERAAQPLRRQLDDSRRQRAAARADEQRAVLGESDGGSFRDRPRPPAGPAGSPAPRASCRPCRQPSANPRSRPERRRAGSTGLPKCASPPRRAKPAPPRRAPGSRARGARRPRLRQKTFPSPGPRGAPWARRGRPSATAPCRRPRRSRDLRDRDGARTSAGPPAGAAESATRRRPRACAPERRAGQPASTRPVGPDRATSRSGQRRKDRNCRRSRA